MDRQNRMLVLKTQLETPEKRSEEIIQNTAKKTKIGKICKRL